MMAATLGSLVSETKRNRLSLIGPLTEDEVLLVWEKVAQFVETLMLQQKGVSIGGLGTFTFSKRKIEVGNNRVILIQRPVFVLSEKFKQTHSLHCVKKHASGQVPLHTLNYTQLSNQTGISRELVEAAVREVLQALSRAVAAKKSIEFDLKDVGRLTIHDGKAKLSFFREFILRLDGCSDMEGVFRTSSTDSSICSIMSNPQSSSSRPSTSLSLPRIVQPVPDEGKVNLSLEYSGDSSAETSPSIGPSNYEDTRLSRQLERGALRMTTISEEDEEEEEEEEEERDSCRDGVYVVGENGEISGKSDPSNKKPTAHKATSDKSSQQTLTPKPAMLLVGSGESPQTTLESLSHHPNRVSYTSTCSSRQTGDTRREVESRTYTSSGSGRRSNRQTTTTSYSSSRSCSCSLGPTPAVTRPSTCSHKSSAGQELCYLCHQRALRNIPVDLSKETAAKEKLYNDTIHEYQRRHELLAMARAQADKTKRRLLDQEVASFNQSMAHSKKQKGTKSSEMDPSYIFSERLVTPAPHASQQAYCRELDSQVERNMSRQQREREEAKRSGREEQERLAKELATYEELYRRMKAQSVEDYKTALNEQVGLKCQQSSKTARDGCMVLSLAGRRPENGQQPPLLSSSSSSSHSLTVPPPNTLRPFTPPPSDPTLTHICNRMTRLKQNQLPQEAPPTTNHAHQPHPQHPVFGVQQTASVLESSERERSKVFFLDQLTMVEEKQRRAREKALKTLQQESEMLKTTKEGLKEDLRREKSRRVQVRQALEEEWLASMRDKQRKLLDDLHRAREQGMRLHQQCERYLRCKQCQRKRENMGKSNILHETRYTSGSRLMV